MRKMTLILAAAMMMTMTACGQKETAETAPMESLTEAETIADSETETSVEVEESVPEETIENEETDAPAKEETSGETAKEESGNGFEDNFAVDAESAAAFAEEIQTAVAAEDLDALADLAFYPLYVGFADGSVSAKSSEDLMKLGADRIFTAEMTESIANADFDKLAPSMAGFSLSKDGRPNITFGVVDGELHVMGLNY